jgi:hypothetical protein
VNSVAARRRSRPLYEVFLERVIQIEAVQCHRPAADQDTAEFFVTGRRHGVFGDFHWSLDAREPFPWPLLKWVKPSVALPMQDAWNAAIAAFTDLIADIINGEWIANGVHPPTGLRRDLDRAELMRTHLVLDVRNGDLFERKDYGSEARHRKLRLRWTAITLRAVKQPQQKGARGHGHDWPGAWDYALTLRAEDQWDWTQIRRHKKQPLPAVRKIVEQKIVDWFAARGNVPHMSDIRRNITKPLYAGRLTRGKRKR